MKFGFSRSRLALAVAAALGAAAVAIFPGSASADRERERGDRDRDGGSYLAGDIHNHTTCSDGSTSMQKLVKKATDKVDTPFGLDWFVQAGHGNSGGTRNCTLVEDDSLSTPAYPFIPGTGPNTTWSQSIGEANVKGDPQTGNNPPGYMWRWQSVQEYEYPLIEYLSALKDLPLFQGIESIVAGHEHTSMSVISGQIPPALDAAALPTSPGPITARYTPLGNADGLAQWVYCFDAGVTDTSRGNVRNSTAGNNWDCSNPASAASTDPAIGWTDAAKKLIPAGGTGTGNRGHAKTVEAVKWMAAFHPQESYYLPTHLERAGPFNPNGNNGFNIEHLRNFNNAGPQIAFGFETQPGHGASQERGEYTIRRNNIGGVNTDSVGGTTYGGTGVYGAQVGGVWDALLGEGRNYWFHASSDWHNRGTFGGDDRRTTQDFFPGEYQRSYTLVRVSEAERERRGHDSAKPTPQQIVDGLRTGNTFAASGQLIDRLAFIACDDRSESSAEAAAVKAALENTAPERERCVTMGEKLVVRPGSDISVAIVVRDPAGTNYSPYSFDNPSLLQVKIHQPLNAPVLDHIDVIRGMVSGYKTPGAADYSGQWPNDWIQPYLSGAAPTLASVPAGAKNTTASVIRTFSENDWTSLKRDPEFKVMTFKLSNVRASQYVRLRGSNLPANVPFETDASGNPLPDVWTNSGPINPTRPGGTDGIPRNANLRIPCTTVGTNVPSNSGTFSGTGIDGCPSHLPLVNGQKMVAFDVAAWADLWFYSNPIFIEVKGSTTVAGIK